MKNVFPAKSAENSGKTKKGGNVSEQTDAPKTTDRDDGNKTNPIQQGPQSASERGMAPPPSTSSTATPTATSMTVRDLHGDKTKDLWYGNPSYQVQQGQDRQEDPLGHRGHQHRLQQRVLVNFWKGGFHKSGQIRKNE